LDGERKKSVLQFLYEAQLINRDNREKMPLKWEEAEMMDLEARIVGLSGADLRNAYLRYVFIEGAALDGAILENADLRNAQLRRIDLGGAYLSGADLSGAYLSEASLQNAQLQPNDELNLRGADLRGANLSGTNLYEATGWTEEQLTAAWSLEGATMPDGQRLRSAENPDGPTFEDWLQDRENRQQDE
jgi:uncharacterized protein YjbI with pentapeptide repeats